MDAMTTPQIAIPTATSPHWIKVRISAEAQKIALLAGLPAQSEQRYPVNLADVPALLRIGGKIDGNGIVGFEPAPYIELRDDGGFRWDSSYYGRVESFPALTARPASGADAISMIEAQIDRMRREHEEKRIAHEAQVAANAAANAEREKKQAEADAISAQERQMRAAAKKRFDQYLAEMAFELGDENAAARVRMDQTEGRPLGRLPRDEALEILRGVVLPVDPTRGLVEYMPLEPGDIRGCDSECMRSENDGEHTSFRIVPADVLSAAQYESVKRIFAALAEAKLPAGVMRIHVAECTQTNDCPRVGATRVGVLVKHVIDVEGAEGESALEREYGEPPAGWTPAAK